MQVIQPNIFFPKADCDKSTIFHEAFFSTSASTKCMDIVNRVKYILENPDQDIEKIQENILAEISKESLKKDQKNFIILRVAMEWALAYYKHRIDSKRAVSFTLEDVLFRQDLIREVFVILLNDPVWKKFFSTPAFRMVREELVFA
jgi:hypothetical protein